MILNIIKSMLVLLSISYHSPAFSERYDLTEINEPQIIAINNIGTIIGLTADNAPYVWRRDQETMSYPAETDLPIDERTYRLLLPTDIAPEATDFHVSSINSESLDADGKLINDDDGTIVGSYLDSNDIKQSVIWYKKIVANKIQYVALKLAPHKSFAAYCKGTREQHFPLTECLYLEDSELIYRATLCNENSQWEMPNDIFISALNSSPPVCQEADTLPICEYKLKKIPDDTEIIQGENEDLIKNTYIYEFNEKYKKQECIVKEHAALILQAMQCNNTFNAIGDPITIQCDNSSEATGINDENAIIGTSYKIDGGKRPIIWLREEELNEEGNPAYSNIDLGKLRESNDADESIIESKEDNELSPEITISYRNGYTTAISSNSTPNVVGMLRIDDPESLPTPVAWFDITPSSFDLPLPLLAPASTTITKNPCTPIPPSPKLFPSTVEVKSIDNKQIVGWYEDDTLTPRPITWRECKHTITLPSGEKIKTTTIASSHVFTTQTNNTGKALATVASKIVGTQQIEIETNDITETEKQAFIYSSRCGPQNLNELLVDLDTDNNLLLEEAYDIANGRLNFPLLAKGKLSNGEIKPYILTPKKVFVDLEVKMKPHKSSLEVGSQQTISFTVINNGAVDNITSGNTATCVFFRISSTVYEGETYEDKIKEAEEAGILIDSDLKIEFNEFPKIEDELIAGLTFSDFSSSSEEVKCNVNQVEIFCALAKLPPNKALTITVRATPRPMLADRIIRTHVSVFSTETEPEDLKLNNADFQLVSIEREGCFIATAAYGSYLMPELKTLRQFRDDVLLKNSIGEYFVQSYYDISPPLAAYIAQDESRRAVTRLLLTPVVYSITHPITSLLLLAILSGFFISRRYKKK